MYYTGKGDKGTTKLFNSVERISKADNIFEVLGSLDELNSWLGYCAIEAQDWSDINKIIIDTQQTLFICQAYFAESDVQVPKNILVNIEKKIKEIGQTIKPRDSFVLSGGSKLSALLDISRTIARKVERRAVKLSDYNLKNNNQLILAYLNRLSSLLYVLARQANDRYQIKENKPSYKI